MWGGCENFPYGCGVKNGVLGSPPKSMGSQRVSLDAFRNSLISSANLKYSQEQKDENQKSKN